MGNKRIYFTVTNDLNYDQRMIRICGTLAQEGYEVHLIGRKRKHSKPLVAQPFKQTRLRLFFDKGKWFYIEYNLRLFFFFLFRKFDAICAIDLDTILFTSMVARWKGKPLIYDAHEYFTEVPEVVHRPRIKRIWEWVARKTIPQLKYAYTVCTSLSKIFEERYGVPFEVIRNVPVQGDKKTLSIKSLALENRPLILLYQGYLNDGRGLEEMIGALPELENVEFWMAGEGDRSEALRALTKKLGVENKVKFLGYVLPKDLKAITQKADIGLNLLQNKGLNYYYSLANKFFDYIQAGKPSLNMAFPEYKHLVGQYPVGILLENLKTNTIVNAIQELTQNPEKYQQMQEACQIAARELIWEKEAEKLKGFYKKIWE